MTHTWHQRAACIGAPDTDFFPDDRGATPPGIVYCRTCPVQPACLADALRYEKTAPSGRYGLVGGLTAAQRARVGG